MEELDGWVEEARAWVAARRPPRKEDPSAIEWGVGSDDVSVFHALSFEDERDLLAAAAAWQQEKFDAGYAAITWPVEYGGAGLPVAFDRAFSRLEAAFDVPRTHETFSVTTSLIAPTVRLFGTDEQRDRFVRRFLRVDELCCQLFSEPGAGSDLASLSTRAVADGDEWVITGQKVWSSGAQFSGWGECICRTDPAAEKHAGLTAFLVPMDAPGVDVRPIRQMSGGSSFNEVFLDGVRVPDSLRLGDVGAGWKVALTTLGFERGASSSGGGRTAVGGSWPRLLALAAFVDRTGDPVMRQQLAEVYIHTRINELNARRASAGAVDGRPPGPEGSIGKLRWTQGMAKMSAVASTLLGPRLTADTGEWGTFAWADHVLGAPGYRIAGGSDEVQRNIIAERVLGLPRDR